MLEEVDAQQCVILESLLIIILRALEVQHFK